MNNVIMPGNNYLVLLVQTDREMFFVQISSFTDAMNNLSFTDNMIVTPSAMFVSLAVRAEQYINCEPSFVDVSRLVCEIGKLSM